MKLKQTVEVTGGVRVFPLVKFFDGEHVKRDTVMSWISVILMNTGKGGKLAIAAGDEALSEMEHRLEEAKETGKSPLLDMLADSSRPSLYVSRFISGEENFETTIEMRFPVMTTVIYFIGLEGRATIEVQTSAPAKRRERSPSPNTQLEAVQKNARRKKMNNKNK